MERRTELGRDKRKREEIKERRREGRGKGGKKGGRRKKGSEGRVKVGGRREKERREREKKKSGGPNKALLTSFSYFSFQTGRCPVSLRSGSRHWTHGAPSYLLDLCQR